MNPRAQTRRPGDPRRASCVQDALQIGGLLRVVAAIGQGGEHASGPQGNARSVLGRASVKGQHQRHSGADVGTSHWAEVPAVPPAGAPVPSSHTGAGGTRWAPHGTWRSGRTAASTATVALRDSRRSFTRTSAGVTSTVSPGIVITCLIASWTPGNRRTRGSRLHKRTGRRPAGGRRPQSNHGSGRPAPCGTGPAVHFGWCSGGAPSPTSRRRARCRRAAPGGASGAPDVRRVRSRFAGKTPSGLRSTGGVPRTPRRSTSAG